MFNRYNVIEYKNSIMNSYRYCLKVYDTGFDNIDQFESFKQLCQNHVNICNFYHDRIKPIFGKIQYKRYKLYNDFKSAASFTIEDLSDILTAWQDSYNQAIEEAKAKTKIEEQLRLEHEIALEYREIQHKNDRNAYKKTSPIGFKTNSIKPKPKRTKKINKKINNE